MSVLVILAATLICTSLLDIIDLIALFTKMAVIGVSAIAAATGIIAVMAIMAVLSRYDLDGSIGQNSSYDHGFNIFEFYYIAYISNSCCYGYGHNGSNFYNSHNGHIGCYGHTGLNEFKCCKGFNCSNGSSRCIEYNDPNGRFDVMDFMAKKTVMALMAIMASMEEMTKLAVMVLIVVMAF